MWKIYRTSCWLIGTITFVSGFTAASHAQEPGYYYTNRTVQNGFTLPHVPVPNGYDEIRAADGTTCKSSMANNGAYLDVGGIGNQDIYGSFNSGSVYARIIMPLGERPKRLDCSKLYRNEIERLQHELALLKMGGAGLASATHGSGGKSDWANDGWSNENWNRADAARRNSLSPPAHVGSPAARRPQPVQQVNYKLNAPSQKLGATNIRPWREQHDTHYAASPPLPSQKAEATWRNQIRQTTETNGTRLQPTVRPVAMRTNSDWSRDVLFFE